MRSSFKIVLDRKGDLNRIAELSKAAGLTPAQWCTKVVQDALRQPEVPTRQLTPEEQQHALDTMNSVIDKWKREPVRIEQMASDPRQPQDPETVRPDDASVTITQELSADEVRRRYPSRGAVNPNAYKPPIARQGGVCDTTSTPRNPIADCTCPTYPENLGPCLTWEEGGNGRCPYCDHEKACHDKAIATSGHRSWAQEYDRMDKMSPADAVAHGKKLLDGRRPPYGFRDWGRQERIEWLDREWPLQSEDESRKDESQGNLLK